MAESFSTRNVKSAMVCDEKLSQSANNTHRVGSVVKNEGIQNLESLSFLNHWKKKKQCGQIPFSWQKLKNQQLFNEISYKSFINMYKAKKSPEITKDLKRFLISLNFSKKVQPPFSMELFFYAKNRIKQISHIATKRFSINNLKC